MTYRTELIRCGKPGCKCLTKQHGPYWYRYWRAGKKLRKQYAGKASNSQLNAYYLAKKAATKKAPQL